jgi:hypothetical protein
VIGRKLVSFKNTSFAAADIGTFPSLQIVTLARDVGLASLYGLINTGEVLVFVTQSDIRISDGFKFDILNKEWIEDFKLIDPDLVTNCLAWNDPIGRSQYFQFYTYAKASQYVLWVRSQDDGQWRNEDFRYLKSSSTPSDDALPVYADLQGACYFIYATKDEYTGRTLLLDDQRKSSVSLSYVYQFPRIDNLETNRVVNFVHGELADIVGIAELPTYCYFKTNAIQAPDGASEIYINGGYVRSSIKKGSGFYLNVYDGDTRARRLPIEYGREETTVGLNYLLKRFALSSSFTTAVKFIITEFGIFVKQFVTAGSVKQEL